MAPVKAAPRATRSTRAATVAKQNATTSSKTSDAPPTRKVAASKTTKTAPTTRRTRTKTEETVSDEEDELQLEDTKVEEKPPTRSQRATKATTKSTAPTLSTAPRRRLKVTPLDAPEPASAPLEKEKPKRGKTETVSKVKKATTKAKQKTDDDKDAEEEVEADVPKARSTRSKAVVAKTSKATEKSGTVRKTRIVPKKDEPATVEQEPMIQSVRATRSNRAGSVASSMAPEMEETKQETVKAKSTTAPKKKVTFHDISEDDKENIPLPSKGKKTTAMKKTTGKEVAAKGIKAKPVRKPASTTATTTRTQKTSTTTKSGKLMDKDATKSITRALTPKKITQIARAATPEDEQEGSDSEDELNGAKTPVRDLTLSPRRPPTSATANALARSMSPSKTLELGPILAPNSPQKSTATIDGGGALASSARRLPASPFKDSIRESPKRGLGNASRLLFSPSKDGEHSTTVNLAIGSQSSQATDSNMLMQSPKRSAVLDPEKLFPQSAIKSSKKSPFKASLLGSPAKRSLLFSPSKKQSSSPVKGKENIGRLDLDEMDVTGLIEENTEELMASSHQRPLASPLRVHRISDDELQLDFDDSVLPVRSPLKLVKSPNKSKPTSIPEFDENLGRSAEIHSVVDSNIPVPEEEHQFVEPKMLESHGEPSGTDSSNNHSASEQEDDEKSLKDSPQRSDLNKSPVVKQYRDHEDSFEDELATDDTPDRPLQRRKSFRPSLTGRNDRTRQSLNVSSLGQGQGFGFTPLAMQMEGWKASSPDKQNTTRRESAEFSPLARGHVDGEVVVSRDNTPVQKLKLLARASGSRTSSPSSSINRGRKSIGLRKSIAQRESMVRPFQEEEIDNLAQGSLFEEEMDVRAEEQEIHEHRESIHDVEQAASAEDQDFEDIMQIDGRDPTPASEDEDDTVLVHEVQDEESVTASPKDPEELTTDLVNFTNASDTAMVDFQKLAEEADHLASDALSPVKDDFDGIEDNVSTHTDTDDQNNIDKTGEQTEDESTPKATPHVDHNVHNSPISLLEHELTNMISSPVDDVSQSMPASVQDNVTPIAAIRVPRNFNLNTIVSKVPLRPEGDVSPIKMPKKRSLSFGASNTTSRPNKRVSFGRLPDLPKQGAETTLSNDPEPSVESDSDQEILEAEKRMQRTSVAPSPGGTSTPATIKSVRSSLGGTSTTNTPGRLSFAVSDFGDSTLDGIELPSDYEGENGDKNEQTVELATGELTMMGGAVEDHAQPPSSAIKNIATPVTTKSTSLAINAATPTTAAKTPTALKPKTPGTSRKTSAKTPGTANMRARTPLKPMADGALSSATVFVDVRTSEGADASGIFVELLTSLGAKCVREWRWNGRASLAPGDHEEQANTGPGITHVVFKDGSPKTLERVRQASASNFNIFCVGVGWVLDCEKEGKWIDETNYLVDKAVMAKALANSASGTKGGSRRRKSMEPSTLVADGFGSVKRSVSRARRSVSAEMLEGARKNLREIATPKTPATAPYIEPVDRDDDAENVAPSPVGSDDAGSPSGAATPTGYVSYDPRTAATPGSMTPYLVSEGKKLVQMSAPPKQQRLSIFADPNGENEENEGDNESEIPTKKYKLSKGNLNNEKRRQTLGVGLGFKPVIGSPLGREFR